MKKIFASIAICTLMLTALAAKPSVVVLRPTASLYVATDGNNVKWASEVTAGTLLDGSSTESVTKNIVTKEKTWNDVPFYAVTYEKKNYFIQTRDSSAVENATSAAVVVDAAVLFSKPHLATFRNALLEPGTIVSCDTDQSSTKAGFTKITFFDTDDIVRRTRYVLSESISNDTKDIKAIQLLEKARSIKDEGLKKEFLANAAKTAANAALSRYIAAETNKILGISSFSDDDIVQLDSYGASIYTADGSKINVRSAPGTAGEKIAQLENGWYVIVCMKTNGEETIEGITDSWYYVQQSGGEDSEGIEGWVFGGYLKTDEE